MKIAVKIGKA